MPSGVYDRKTTKKRATKTKTALSRKRAAGTTKRTPAKSAKRRPGRPIGS
jgi:hypothetical protein